MLRRVEDQRQRRAGAQSGRSPYRMACSWATAPLCTRERDHHFLSGEKKKHDEEMYLNIRFFSQLEGIIYIFQH